MDWFYCCTWSIRLHPLHHKMLATPEAGQTPNRTYALPRLPRSPSLKGGSINDKQEIQGQSRMNRRKKMRKNLAYVGCRGNGSIHTHGHQQSLLFSCISTKPLRPNVPPDGSKMMHICSARLCTCIFIFIFFSFLLLYFVFLLSFQALPHRKLAICTASDPALH